MQKYYNRETAPLKRHEKIVTGALLFGIFCIVTMIFELAKYIIQGNASTLPTVRQFGSILFSLAFGVFGILEFIWGRKFKKEFLIVLTAEFALGYLIILLFFLADGPSRQLLFVLLVYAVGTISEFIYYRKLLPLFDSNYTGLEPGQSVEINYDRLNQQETGTSED